MLTAVVDGLPEDPGGDYSLRVSDCHARWPSRRPAIGPGSWWRRLPRRSVRAARLPWTGEYAGVPAVFPRREARKFALLPQATGQGTLYPEPDLNRYAREGQRGLSSPCLHSTIRARRRDVALYETSRDEAYVSRHSALCCLILWVTDEGSDPVRPVATGAGGGSRAAHRAAVYDEKSLPRAGARLFTPRHTEVVTMGTCVRPE
jgi:hypothetical protein